MEKIRMLKNSVLCSAKDISSDIIDHFSQHFHHCQRNLGSINEFFF